MTETKGRGAGRPITGEEVQSWFRDAIGNRNLTPPDPSACDQIATHIESYRSILTKPRTETTLGDDGARDARKWMKHLDRMQRYYGALDSAGAILAEITAARNHTSKILEILDCPIPAPTWHDIARMNVSIAWRIWRPAGDYPRSLNEGDPATIFACASLGSLGIDVGGAAVSDALRERRGVKSEGKIRNVKRP